MAPPSGVGYRTTLLTRTELCARRPDRCAVCRQWRLLARDPDSGLPDEGNSALGA
jgi:hypothetical protein